MTNIEIYINGVLCDVTGNKDVPRLNRVVLVPGEVFTRNAQYSYSITLPFTSRNNEAFGNANIEEVSGKFEREYAAEVVVDSVRIFEGSFLLTEINEGYKGNLFVAWHKSVKDVFKGKKLNELPVYRFNFTDYAEGVNAVNRKAEHTPQPVIFPYVLYGLLPKVPRKDGIYTSKTLWDEYVRMGIDDMPPSVNLVLLLKNMFQNAGCRLTGNALTDDRLRHIYMSYKGASDKAQPWNWSTLGKVTIKGRWNNRDVNTANSLELGVFENTTEEEKTFYSCDLFQCTNTVITSVDDNCGAFKHYTVTDDEGKEWLRASLAVPVSGFYKVTLDAALKVESQTKNVTEQNSKIAYVSGGGETNNTSFHTTRYEFKLLRDRKGGDFNIASSVLDGVFYRDNMNQYSNYSDKYTKFFPQVVNGVQVNFVDYLQNPKFVIGQQWGTAPSQEKNPLDTGWNAQVMAAKPAYALDGKEKENLTRLAINSPGYKGLRGTENVDPIKYKISLRNAPANKAARTSKWAATGSTTAVVWLEKGELLTLASTSSMSRSDDNWGWGVHDIDFTLKLEPFRKEPEWLKVDSYGNGTAEMNYNDPPSFTSGYLNLMEFLPDDMTADAFIDAVCKTFNLKLSQPRPKVYSLDRLQSYKVQEGQFLDLDGIAALCDRTNAPLEIPSLYRFGFSIKEDEQGYVESGEDGGCELRTRKTDGEELEVKSPFSYCWYKTIVKDGKYLLFPVISKSDVWKEEAEYEKNFAKRDTDLPVRFWYPRGVMDSDFILNKKRLWLAQVGEYSPASGMDLSYRDMDNTIYSDFFNAFTNCSTCYTEVECFLKPQEYARLDGSVMVRFNGDLYYVAEVSGYDPSGRNKTKIKLIRKI